jgi:hypothetical protein
MAERSAARSETSSSRRSGRVRIICSRDERLLTEHLLRLRAVVVLSSAPWGTRRETAARLMRDLRTHGLKAARRTLYHWQQRYRRGGFEALVRRRRSGCGRARNEGILASFIESAGRVRRFGDCSREYRRLEPPVSYETFRCWIRRIQAGFRRHDGRF